MVVGIATGLTIALIAVLVILLCISKQRDPNEDEEQMEYIRKWHEGRK